MNIARIVIVTAAALVVAVAGLQKVHAGVSPLDTAFTYQGLLQSGGTPADGTFHLRFQLWNALVGGSQVGADVDAPTVAVSEGLFTLPLDFGSDVFDGSARWLQVQVIVAGPDITLAPRQPISATPYALQTRGIVVDGNNNVGIGTAAPQDDLHVASTTAALRLEDTTFPGGGFTHIWDTQPTQLRFSKTNLNGQVLFDLNPKPANGVSNAAVRLFRETNTTGAKGLYLHRGDNTNSVSTFIGVDGANSFFQAHGGNVGIGTTTPLSPLHVQTDDHALAIRGINTQGSFTAAGVHGECPSGRGVSGIGATGVRGEGAAGVIGVTNGSGGTFAGVMGFATADSGVNIGVYAESDSSSGYDFYAAGAGEDYGSSSSIRWKHNIELIDDPLQRLAQLRGVFFDWDAEHGGHHDVGMIAEEVGAVLPEIVRYEENGIDANGMDYSKLTPLLVEAVKAVRAEKDAEIDALRAEKDVQISQLTARVEHLERMITRLTTHEEEDAR